jgi:hypothetical protein
MSEEDRKILAAQLEAKGPAQVRALIGSGNYPGQLLLFATDWLKSKDDEEALLQAASQAEMAATASRAAVAAERAAAAAESQAASAKEQARIAHKALITARIAAAIGAIALIATIVAYLHPIH